MQATTTPIRRQATITPLRRQIDEPGEFLDWLIDRGYSIRGACLMVMDPTHVDTQRYLIEFLSDAMAEADAS